MATSLPQRTEYDKPLPPGRDPLAAQFYDWIRQHELRFQRCMQCGTWRHTPRPMCAKCSSWDWEWARSTGKGKVFTWTISYQAFHPAFKDCVPFAAVVVELEEGPRMLASVSCAMDELTMDMPVEVHFEQVTEDFTFARFRPITN